MKYKVTNYAAQTTTIVEYESISINTRAALYHQKSKWD